MSAFHQIGHDSEKMLFEPDLQAFRGAILSPVNYEPGDTASLATRAREDLSNFDLWFDPQLYVPDSTRGQIRSWSYFPSDFGTADLTQRAWWARPAEHIVSACKAFSPDVICSPVPLPKQFSNQYYNLCVSVAHDLAARVAGTSMKVAQTVIVSGVDLLAENRPMEIASIVSRTDLEWLYLLIYNETHPRREYDDSLEIEAIVRLIAAIKAAGLKILVGYTSSDMVLWKAAGADAVASGKFFNLRRFNRSRFEQPAEGGGQLPYWFEESLMAFLREADLTRLHRASLLDLSLTNPPGQRILERTPGAPWLAHSWRQYLWWFANCEEQLSTDVTTAEQLLESAEAKWAALPKTILFDEPYNNGAWIRPWRAALLASRN